MDGGPLLPDSHPLAPSRAMSDDPAPQSQAEARSESHEEPHGDPRYASQAAAAEPAPVAFEGGAGAPDDSGAGTTRRSEWVFLVLAVFFSLALVSIPPIFFTSIDLTATPEANGGDGAPDGSEAAREPERLQLLQETRADAFAKLSTYGPIEDGGGAYRIPLDRAMRLTLREDYGSSGDGAQGSGAPALDVPARR